VAGDCVVAFSETVASWGDKYFVSPSPVQLLWASQEFPVVPQLMEKISSGV